VAITRETASSQQAARRGKAQCSPRVRSSTLPARASVLVLERPRPYDSRDLALESTARFYEYSTQGPNSFDLSLLRSNEATKQDIKFHRSFARSDLIVDIPESRISPVSPREIRSIDLMNSRWAILPFSRRLYRSARAAAISKSQRSKRRRMISDRQSPESECLWYISFRRRCSSSK